MSGIGVVFHRDGSEVSRPALERMAGALRMYGRDDQAILRTGPVGFVWSHLGGFTPEDRHEAQPVRSVDGRLVAVFDGRIDDRDALLAALGIARSDAATTPDSAVFVAAWARWGVEAGARVVGEWAALVWDGRAGELHAARDAMGRRSLHLHERDDRVVLASAPKAIHALGDVPRELDELKLADSLILNFQDQERGWFAGISRIAPGTVVTFTDRGRSSRRVRDLLAAPPVRLGSDDEYVEAATELLDRVVRDSLRSAGPIAAHLSAGFDSAAVVATALPVLRERGETLHAYTSIPREDWVQAPHQVRPGDESEGVRRFLSLHPDLRHTFVRSEDRSLTSYLESMVEAYEGAPRNAANLFWIHEIDRLAREDGCRVVLGGQSGNASLTLSGVDLPLALLRRGRLVRLVRELRAVPGRRHPLVSGLLHDVALRGGPAWLTTAHRRLRSGRDPYPAPITDGFAAETDVYGRARQVGFDPTFARRGSHRRMMVNGLLFGAGAEGSDVRQALRALHGTEVRDPLGDVRLVEWCLGVPDDQLRRDGRDRWLAQRVLRGRVPDETLRAPGQAARGRQAADIRLRVRDELEVIGRELDAAAEDPAINRMIDVERMRRIVADGDLWSAPTDPEDSSLDLLVLTRAVATVELLHWARADPQAAAIGAVDRVSLAARAMAAVPVALEAEADRVAEEGA